MPYYRLCLFDDHREVVTADHLNAPDDRSALAMASAMKRPIKFEVWAIDRFVGTTTGREV
jgi:hypothetical protein